MDFTCLALTFVAVNYDYERESLVSSRLRGLCIIKCVLSFRALDDIQESIKELQYYRANVFKASTEEKKRKIVENGGSNNS